MYCGLFSIFWKAGVMKMASMVKLKKSDLIGAEEPIYY